MKFHIDSEWLKRKIMEEPDDAEFTVGSTEVLMTEMEKLKKRLEDKNVKNIKPFWGPEAHKCTPEELAGEINRVLDQLESGDLTELFDVEHGLEFETREQYLEFYKKYPEPLWRDWTGDAYRREYDSYVALLPERFKSFMEEQAK